MQRVAVSLQELQRALEASELEEAMAQSRLAAQDQVQHRGVDTAPSNLGSAAADDQELKLVIELSEAEAKQAAKGKRVMQRTPSEEDLQRALQESANLATSEPQHKQPPYASSAQQGSGEGSSTMQPDQDATDAELARALYESEQLAASSARLSGHAQTAEPSGPASAPMLPPSYTHQSAQATSSSSSPSMPSHNRTAHNQPAHLQPAPDSIVRYPTIYQPGSSRPPSPSSSHQQWPQQQLPRQQLHTSQQGAQQQSLPQGHHMPQQGQSQPPTQQQTAPRQQPAPGHRQLPHHPQHQHGLGQAAGNPSGAGPYLDGYHGSANLESMLTGDEVLQRHYKRKSTRQAKALQAGSRLQLHVVVHSSCQGRGRGRYRTQADALAAATSSHHQLSPLMGSRGIPTASDARHVRGLFHLGNYLALAQKIICRTMFSATARSLTPAAWSVMILFQRR